MNEIYKRIKARREELGYSQDELANKMGYRNRSSIHKIETGVNDIPQSKIKEFADALDTIPAYLMGWTDDIIHTTAAHKENNKEWTIDEINKIEEYKKLLLAARKNRK